jgi:hypothetical protein
MTEENAWLPTEKNIEDYELLKSMLHSQKNEFDLLSKKKADGQLNPMKIKMVNRVLEPLKELCKQEQSYKFLDTLNEDEMPTYSDVVLIISQYETALNEFSSKYYIRDKYQRDTYGDLLRRWMTQEYPPDYYSNEENYDEDEE